MQPFCTVIPANNCLKNLITVVNPCDTEEKYINGALDITALYPDFEWGKIDAITDFHTSSVEELRALRWVAIQKITSDVTGVIQQNGLAANLGLQTYTTTGKADCACTAPANPAALSPYRGVMVQLKKCTPERSIKRLHISELYLWSKEEYTDLEILVKDNYYQYTITIPTVKEGMNDVYALTVIQPLVSEGSQIEIHVNSQLYPDLCATEQYCSCKMNDLDYTFATFDGYKWRSGKGLQGFGITMKAGAVCDFDKVLCIFAGSKLIQWVILYYMGHLISEKVLNSSRVNLYTTFQRADAKAKSEKYYNLYVEKYNELVKGMIPVLRGLDDGCITCKGVKVLSNY